jgi:hypothetical protein
MARNLSAAELAHYQGDTFREIRFVELHFVSGTLYVAEGPRPYTWGGHEWLAMGDYGGVSQLEGSTDLGIRGFTLTLSGIEPQLLASALDRTDYKGRTVVIHVGVMDDSGNLVATPKQRKRGWMDTAMVMADDGVGMIQMQCEAEAMRLMMSNTQRFSHDDHHRRHPNDMIFSLMDKLRNKDVMWGGVRLYGGGNGGAGGPRLNLDRERVLD